MRLEDPVDEAPEHHASESWYRIELRFERPPVLFAQDRHQMPLPMTKFSAERGTLSSARRGPPAGLASVARSQGSRGETLPSAASAPCRCPMFGTGMLVA